MYLNKIANYKMCGLSRETIRECRKILETADVIGEIRVHDGPVTPSKGHASGPPNAGKHTE